MNTIRYTLQDGIATVTFDEPGSPVNTMCLQWQDDLHALATQVLADRAAIRGMLLTSAKSTFFAGADLKATMRLTPADAPAVYAGIERVKQDVRTLETLGIPGSAASTAPPWAAAGRWRWSATTASRWMTRASSSACPRSHSACCPAPAASPK